MNKFLLLLITVCCMLTGCAGIAPMAFNKDAQTIDTSQKSIVLLAIDVRRTDDSRYVPNPIHVSFVKTDESEKEEKMSFKLSKTDDSLEQDGHILYLTRIALAPGKYKLNEIFGNANAFPFNGFFVVPLYMDLMVNPHSITYVGRVTATLRHRHDGEFRAGPPFPLISQAATGVATGTWDVVTENMSEKDLALFRENYPALKMTSIGVVPLPPFDRAEAQRRWEGDNPNDPKDQEAPAPTQSANAQ